MFLLRFLVLLQAVTCFAADPSPCQQMTEAVRSWYSLLANGANQPDLSAFGTVGSGTGPLLKGYGALAPSLRARMSESQHMKHFRGVAEVKLLQARPACQPDSPARVFVEEERTVVLEGFSAIAWYSGFLKMENTGRQWRIADLSDIRPEDLISLRLGGHMPWREDPVEVARLALRCDSRCKAEGGLDTVSVEKNGARHLVHLAHLHNAEWTVIAID